MERNFDRDEFEAFLQQQTDQYKMYPSDSVWTAIYRHLHTKRRGILIGGSLLLLCFGYFFSQLVIIDAGSRKQLTSKEGNSKSVQHYTSFLFNDILAQLRDPFGTQKTIKRVNKGPLNLYIDNNTEPINETATASMAFNNELSAEAPVTKNKENHLSVTYKQPPVTNIETANISIQAADPLTTAASLTSERKKDLASTLANNTGNELSWLKNIATEQYKQKRKNRNTLQVYFSPTISFRELEGDKRKQTTTPVAIQEVNVNRFVNQTPSLGLEMGAALLHHVSPSFALKAGLQMNFTRYNIQAFRYQVEKTTIILNNNGYIPDTIAAYSSLRNMGGYQPEQVQNQYLQVSVPIGAELKLLGNKKMQFNIAGSIQPTYLLANKSYLLSSDFSSYTEQPSLVRKWNVFTSLETYFSYQTKGLRWQIGPQFRYQLMSSYTKAYPIREYLMEYGIKFGVTKSIR